MRAGLRRLGELGILNVMIEGGSTVNGAALATGVADKVFLYYGPQILGGSDSVPFAAGSAVALSESMKITHSRLHYFGEDFAVEGYLRDPYGE